MYINIRPSLLADASCWGVIATAMIIAIVGLVRAFRSHNLFNSHISVIAGAGWFWLARAFLPSLHIRQQCRGSLSTQCWDYLHHGNGQTPWKAVC
jgi:hypothetical protein